MIAAPKGLAAANETRRDRYHVRSLVSGFGAGMSVRKRGKSPVRAYSRKVGDAELRKWREHNVFSRVEKELALRQIFIWADEHKEKGKSWGLLTPKQKDILQVMYHARDYVTGRLDFAYSQICAMAACCSQTLSTAIKRFQALGLVEKWRRSVPVDDPVPDGPRFVQINNAYFLKRPIEVARRVGAALAKLPGIILPAVPPAREPNDHERAALAATASLEAAQGPRNTHYRDSVFGKLIYQINRTSLEDADSSS